MTGRPPLGATTRIPGVIGDPVAHSRSPAIHNAALAALGLDWVYVAFPVPRGRGGDAVRAMAVLGIAGLNVTMPHKEDAAFACDVLVAGATALGARRTRSCCTTTGACTASPPTVRASCGHWPTRGRPSPAATCSWSAPAVRPGRSCAAVGDAGGRVTVAARRVDDGAGRGRAHAGGEARRARGPRRRAVRRRRATPRRSACGANRRRSRPRRSGPTSSWSTPCTPSETPLLAAARARGAAAVNGIGMLVHQGAIAFELLTGARRAARRDASRRRRVEHARHRAVLVTLTVLLWAGLIAVVPRLVGAARRTSCSRPGWSCSRRSTSGTPAPEPDRVPADTGGRSAARRGSARRRRLVRARAGAARGRRGGGGVRRAPPGIAAQPRAGRREARRRARPGARVARLGRRSRRARSSASPRVRSSVSCSWPRDGSGGATTCRSARSSRPARWGRSCGNFPGERGGGR